MIWNKAKIHKESSHNLYKKNFESISIITDFMCTSFLYAQKVGYSGLPDGSREQ